MHSLCHISLLGAILLLPVASVRAEVAITINHNDQDTAEADFHFKEVPAPRRSAAINAAFSVVDGNRDPNGGSPNVLHNRELPGDEDQPSANFFFTGEGGRVVADLGAIIPVKEVDTYSWHSDVRAPQVYQLYGSDGTNEAFNAKPLRSVDLASAGWKLLATVDTRTRFGMAGGQYGLSVADEAGVLGRFRYLLFDVARTTDANPFGNTFFSEVAVLNADAADNPLLTSAVKAASKTYHEAGLRLVITNDDPTFDPAEQERLARTFFTVYPQLLRDFNPAASKSVKFAIEQKYRGVAAAMGAKIVMNPRWFHSNPNDIDVVTHEGMHVIQAYQQWDPGWLREGIADYVRAKYGVDNAGANWSMPDYNPKQSYTDSYRVTARFLTWLERHVKPGVVVALDRAMRRGGYSSETWKELTGKSVDELWQEYGRNPAL